MIIHLYNYSLFNSSWAGIVSIRNTMYFMHFACLNLYIHDDTVIFFNRSASENFVLSCKLISLK